MKRRSQKYYLKMCARCLEEIQTLQGKNPVRFLLLKKKAQKYLQKAKEFEVALPTNQ